MKGLETPFRKSDSKNQNKTVKNNVKMPHVSKNPKIQFSDSILKVEQKKTDAAKLRAWSLASFPHHQTNYFNLTSKIVKLYEQILKA